MTHVVNRLYRPHCRGPGLLFFFDVEKSLLILKVGEMSDPTTISHDQHIRLQAVFDACQETTRRSPSADSQICDSIRVNIGSGDE